MAALVEDLTIFFDEFAVTATLANGATVSVIFDRAHIEVMGGQIDGTQPICVAQTADITANTIAFGTRITIGGTAYQVKGLHPDSTGLTTLMLEEA